MSMQTTYKHIVLNDRGRPVIEGTRMKVTKLIEMHQAYGWSAEELHFQFPDLTLGQIHAALGYYWDHKPELDKQMVEDQAIVEQLRGENKLEHEAFVTGLKTRATKLSE